MNLLHPSGKAVVSSSLECSRLTSAGMNEPRAGRDTAAGDPWKLRLKSTDFPLDIGIGRPNAFDVKPTRSSSLHQRNLPLICFRLTNMLLRPENLCDSTTGRYLLQDASKVTSPGPRWYVLIRFRYDRRPDQSQWNDDGDHGAASSSI